MLDFEYIPPEKLMISAGGKGRGKRLSEFEQVLLTMFFTNTTWNYGTIGSALTRRMTSIGEIERE